jgi:hypothetical protein
MTDAASRSVGHAEGLVASGINAPANEAAGITRLNRFAGEEPRVYRRSPSARRSAGVAHAHIGPDCRAK